MPSSYHNMRTVPPSFSPVVCKSVESKHWWSEYFSLDAWVVATCPGSFVSLSSRPPFCLCTQLPAIHIVGGKIRHSGRDCFSFTWPVLPETDTQAEPGKSVHWALSRSQRPSVKMGDFLHAVPDGRTDEPNLIGSLLITVQLVLRHSLTQKQPGFRPQPCKGKRRRRLGRSRRPSWVRGCISDGRVCGGIQGGGKSW